LKVNNPAYNLAILKLTRFWPLLLLSFFTAFFTFPVIFHFTDAVPGLGVEDRLQNLWNFWWVGKALSQGKNPYLNDTLFFPFYQAPRNPLPLYFHDLQLFNDLVTLPLQWLGGVAAAYNGVVFFSTLVSGAGTYWLIRSLGGSYAAGLVGGSIFAFAPIRLDAINSSITNIQSTQFLPLFAFFLLKIKNNKGLKTWDKKGFFGATLVLTFCIYTDWYNTIYLLAFWIFYFLAKILEKPRSLERVRNEIWLNLWLVGLTLVLVSPLLIPSIANLNNPDFRLVPGLDREVKSSQTLLALFLPGSTGATWDSCAVGYTGLLLGIVAFLSLLRLPKGKGWLTRPTVLYWQALTVFSTVMALGPSLRLTADINTGLPLPYALFRLLPAVSITRAPGRFLILTALGLGVLAGLALDWLATATLLKWRSRPKSTPWTAQAL
jgi:hypothetical protein